MAGHAEIPSVDRLNKLFHLDAERGLLIHKKKCGVMAGTVAGSKRPDGYYRVKIDGRLYLVHRIIYTMHYGASPKEKEVDHIDGNRNDSRPSNLRTATRNQNRQNVGRYKSNSVGHRGVWFDKTRKAFLCAVQADGVRDTFGPFKTREQAAKVYEKEAKLRFGEFYRGVN